MAIREIHQGTGLVGSILQRELHGQLHQGPWPQNRDQSRSDSVVSGDNGETVAVVERESDPFFGRIGK